MRKWFKITIAAAATVAMVGIGLAQGNGADRDLPTGRAFLTKASEINLTEVEVGKLAQQKASQEAVRQFGKLMVADHSHAEQDLQSAAAKVGMTAEKQAGTEAKDLKEKLSAQSGREFDETYLQVMLKGHKDAIRIFEHEVAHDDNTAIRKYAENVLPVIQDHIRVAENVAGQLMLSGKQGLWQPDKAIMASSNSGS